MQVVFKTGLLCIPASQYDIASMLPRADTHALVMDIASMLPRTDTHALVMDPGHVCMCICTVGICNPTHR